MNTINFSVAPYIYRYNFSILILTELSKKFGLELNFRSERGEVEKFATQCINEFIEIIDNEAMMIQPSPVSLKPSPIQLIWPLV